MPAPTTPDYTPYLITIISKLDEILTILNNLPGDSGIEININVPELDTDDLCDIIQVVSKDYKRVHGIT